MTVCHVCGTVLPYHSATCYVPLMEMHRFSQQQASILRDALSDVDSAALKLNEMAVVPENLSTAVNAALTELSVAVAAAEQITVELSEQTAARWAASN